MQRAPASRERFVCGPQGVPGVVTSDCLFEKEFKRMFEKDGWSGDLKEKGLLNGRAAYTNTVRRWSSPAARAQNSPYVDRCSRVRLLCGTRR